MNAFPSSFSSTPGAAVSHSPSICPAHLVINPLFSLPTAPSEDSSCYSEDPAHLEEYVLNNSGRIWIGTHDNHYGHPWQFGQYKKESLEVALYILDLMDAEERGDPIKVCCLNPLLIWYHIQFLHSEIPYNTAAYAGSPKGVNNIGKFRLAFCSSIRG